MESGQNECFESNVLFDIMDEMEEKMWRGYSLIIQGYPMLTQFTAGVIYLMGHLFDKVCVRFDLIFFYIYAEKT